MKKFIFISVFFAVGCSSPSISNNKTNETSSKIDSIIKESQQNLFSVDSASKKTDSTITGKVEKTVQQISSLKDENKKLKQENNALKVQLNNIRVTGKPFELLPVSND